ncbi:protein/domain typically associated with flavoprotein oxygenase, DIM6/NTAB family protein [Bacterioplanes sanyensis]|uniref:Protein/domain typically associated with flavoprotein oxygenase, DIM6/NTAB family protein n=1 Tax=Bacterioplanes sanyensis TaxID=1249553 RepID=A0A222FKW4_9GAMM|nr:flavin reductase family protein [Bacterioplanes sanyensis]ASP39302.1 protein/domain typically associated with flavoprotein oxygenase, DIM6/NTAB family protein [Bacterioplanes sanyensis]
MDVDLQQLSPNQCYHWLTQTVIPRPVAWILTRHANGELNLAPFSFFAPVCSNPPTLMVSIGHKNDGSVKDTCANLRTGKAVVHIASMAQLDALNHSAISLADGESELQQEELKGLQLVDWQGSPLPRIKAAPVAMLCRWQQQLSLGASQQNIVFLQIEKLYCDDAVLTQQDQRVYVDAEGIDPLARLGGTWYAGLGELFSKPRPE